MRMICHGSTSRRKCCAVTRYTARVWRHLADRSPTGGIERENVLIPSGVLVGSRFDLVSNIRQFSTSTLVAYYTRSRQ